MSSLKSERFAVHPHVRGERDAEVPCLMYPYGSSPRAWGTAKFDGIHSLLRRFIPTCVGNGTQPIPWPCPLPVHPHVRGERVPGANEGRGLGGSSPRAWGTALIINAFGGNIPVHPHVRGERSDVAHKSAALPGSSPRAWGTVHLPAAPQRPIRFIPTCVGNGRTETVAGLNRTVHPHVRGERAEEHEWATAGYGSSPRAWGTVPRARCPEPAQRFIPTCVGNGWR